MRMALLIHVPSRQQVVGPSTVPCVVVSVRMWVCVGCGGGYPPTRCVCVCVCFVKVRGHENLTMIAPYEKKLSFLGLGTSVGTGGSILTADIIVVRTYDELTVGALVHYPSP